MKQQIFMDTAFLIAVTDESDDYHNVAVETYKKLIEEKWNIFTTDAVLIEIGNGLSKEKWRKVAHTWITQIRRSSKIFRVIPTTAEILNMAVDLYGTRQDKEWGMTDCISFVVMKKYKLSDVLTSDHHFRQAGFNMFMETGS